TLHQSSTIQRHPSITNRTDLATHSSTAAFLAWPPTTQQPTVGLLPVLFLLPIHLTSGLWQDIRRELGINIIDEQKVQLSKAMIIVAWNGSGNPSAIFNGDVFKKVLSVFITAAILKLGQ
ncbi:hypothetical protein S83_056121, partial [Arachis hypogaea]